MTYLVSVLSLVGIGAFVALSAYLLLICGQISFGQQAFFGIGAYVAGMATAMWGLGLAPALLLGAASAAVAAMVVGMLTLRLAGLYFAIATLAFAEMTRLALLLFRYQVEIDGQRVGPNGAEGFRSIRYLIDRDIAPLQYLAIVALVLGMVVAFFLVLERTRLGLTFRMVGEDELAAALQGVDLTRYKVLAAGTSGAIAGLGGGLFAHFMTFIDPASFGVMLGVHSLAYGMVGGLGTVLGPLFGVAVDVGLLESLRVFSAYRMIIFGNLVALILILRPRGLLDEQLVHRLGVVSGGALRAVKASAR